MRTLTFFGLAALAALVAAGLAIASHALTSSASVSATFSAAPARDNVSWTCTGSDGIYQHAHGTWSGTSASGDQRLAGALTIRGTSLVNTTTGVGWFTGRLTIDTASGREDTTGSFTGVIAGGRLHGFVNGRVHDDGGLLLGSISAAVDPSGFTSGQIGTGSSADTAIILGRGDCRKPAPQPRNVNVEQGRITALSTSSITFAPRRSDPVTCAVSASLAADLAAHRFAAGDVVSARCALADGQYRLQKIVRLDVARESK